MDRTGRSRKQWTWPPLRWGILVSIILGTLLSLVSCTRPVPAEETYTRVQTDIRQGNLAAAQERLLPEIESWEGRDRYWHNKLRLLLAEVRLAQGQAGEALALLTDPSLEIEGNEELQIRKLTSLGNAYLKLSRYQESEEALAKASALLDKTSQNSIVLEIELFKSLLEIQRGEVARAEERLQAIQEQAKLQDDSYYGAAALNNLGLMRIRQYRYDEAVPWLEEARSASLEAGARRFTAAIIGNLSLCYTRLGNFDRALELRQEAMGLQETIGDSIGLQSSWGEAGNLYFYQRQLDQAEGYYRKAYDLAQEVGAVSDASKWAGNLATTYIEMRQWQEAQKFNEIARQLKEEVGDLESLAYSLLNQAAIEVGRGRLSEGELLYQRVLDEASGNPALQWEAHAGLGDLYLSRNSTDQAYRHFELAIQLIDRARSDLMRQDFRITFLSRLIRFYQRYVEILIQNDHLERALQVIESSRARILREGLGVEADRSEWTLARVKDTARRQNIVFLSYWLAPSRSYVWVVTPKEVRVIPLPGEAELEKLVENYQAAVMNLRDPLKEVNAAGAALFEAVIEPARELVPAGSQVVIVPDGCLHGLNFETLPLNSSRPGYWIEEVTTVVSPTLRIGSSPFQSSTGPGEDLLLIGDPVPVEPDYPRLRYAAEEIDSMRDLFEGRVHLLTGSEATAGGFVASNPARFPLIHFTTHAEANRVSPLDSAVILTPQGGDYKLYARDLLKTELSADLVTVSACRGAGARAYAGEGLIGFAWAFLHAGARNVVAGLWDVSDASTAQLISSFYRHLATGVPVPRALREAKLELIHSSGNYRKPFYWGPFQVYVQ